MCMPHGNSSGVGSQFKRREKSNRKKIVFDAESRMKADPDFEDQRTNPLKFEKKESFLDKVLNLFR